MVNPTDHTPFRPDRCVAKRLSHALSGDCRIRRKGWRYIFVCDVPSVLLVAVPLFECVTHRHVPKHHISQLHPLCQVISRFSFGCQLISV